MNPLDMKAAEDGAGVLLEVALATPSTPPAVPPRGASWLWQMLPPRLSPWSTRIRIRQERQQPRRGLHHRLVERFLRVDGHVHRPVATTERDVQEGLRGAFDSQFRGQ